MDVVLMDLQYTKAMIDMLALRGLKLPLSEAMVSRIATVAANAKPQVNVFRRFALMRQWEDDGIPLDALIDRLIHDRLHTGKWATDCVAQALC